MVRKQKKRQCVSLATRPAGGGQVRIVAGSFKRTPLAVSDRDGLRPTPQRVRETLFDWLMHLTGGLDGAVVCDMFAGSGALGIEAVSRGAARAVLLEKNRKTAQAISGVVQKLHAQERIEVISTDAIAWMRRTQECFDVIFIDPPFAQHLHASAVEAVKSHLSPQGWIYLENDEPIDEALLQSWGLQSLRRAQAGAVHYLLACVKTD